MAVVLGYQFDYEQNLESCLAKANIPHLDGGFNIPDAQELGQYPLHRAYVVPTIDERTLEKLEGAMATGELTTKNVLGVILDDCPGTQSSWTRVGLPFIKAHGLKVGYTYTGTCGTGDNASLGSEVSSIPGVLVQMRQNGVDRIMFNGVSEGPALLLFSTAAQSQSYQPAYLVSSLANLATVGGEAPAAQMANVYGFGWLPEQDLTQALQPPPNAAQTQCTSMIASQGVHPQSATDYQYAYYICDAVFLYEDALKATGGVTTGSQVIAAIDALGTSFQSTFALGGATTFGSGHVNNPPASYRAITYGAGCKLLQLHRGDLPDAVISTLGDQPHLHPGVDVFRCCEDECSCHDLLRLDHRHRAHPHRAAPDPGEPARRRFFLIPLGIVAYTFTHYVSGLPTGGNDLGLVIGCLLARLSRWVSRAACSPGCAAPTGAAFARAGVSAAALWVASMGARLRLHHLDHPLLGRRLAHPLQRRPRHHRCRRVADRARAARALRGAGPARRDRRPRSAGQAHRHPGPVRRGRPDAGRRLTVVLEDAPATTAGASPCVRVRESPCASS